MKIIVPFLATVFLAAMTFAQEESASPAAESTATATEEKASATVEETPAAKAAAPAEATKAEAAASPKAATSATEKKEATAATATAKAAPAAAAPTNTKGMGPKELENAWEAAIASHNFATLDGLIATDFVGVSSKGKFINRSQVLSEAKGDKDTYKSAKNEKMNVKMFGANVAVVTGRAHEVGTGKDGKAFNRTFLYTDTWMMRAGKWQCIGSQVSKIKG